MEYLKLKWIPSPVHTCVITSDRNETIEAHKNVFFILNRSVIMRNTNDASDKTFLLSGFLSLFVAFLNLGLFFTHFYGDTATYFAAGLSRIIQFDD